MNERKQKRGGGRGDTGQQRHRLAEPAAHLRTAGQSAPQPRNGRMCVYSSVRDRLCVRRYLNGGKVRGRHRWLSLTLPQGTASPI